VVFFFILNGNRFYVLIVSKNWLYRNYTYFSLFKGGMRSS